MKYDFEELLKSTYHHGETPTDTLNQTVLRMVKECDEMNHDNLQTGNLLDGKKQERIRSAQGRRQGIGYGSIRRTAVVAAAFTLVVLLGSGAVYAAGKIFGINDFLQRFGRNGISEETGQLVDEHPTVTVKSASDSKDIVDFKVTSVLCDSKYVTVTLDVSVKDTEKYFLVTGVTDLTDPVSCMDVGIDSSESIGDYCSEYGLQPVQINTKLDKKSEKFADIRMRDYEQSGTGDGSIMICAQRLTDDKSFTMGIKTSVILSEGEEYDCSLAGDALQIDVEDNSTEESAYYRVKQKEQYHVPGTAITIKEVKLTTTEVGTYSEITYVDDSTSEDPSVDWLYLCKANGEMLEANILAGGTCHSVGNNEYVASDGYQSIGLPDTVYVSLGDMGKVVKLIKYQ